MSEQKRYMNLSLDANHSKKFVYLPPRQHRTHWTTGSKMFPQQAISTATRTQRFSRLVRQGFLQIGRANLSPITP